MLLSKLPKPSSLNTMNGLSNRAQHASALKGRPATDAVMTQAKNNGLAQCINPFKNYINVRTVTMFNTAKRPTTTSITSDKGHTPTWRNLPTPTRHAPAKNAATTPTNNATSREMLTNARAIVDSAIMEFGIVEKSVADPKYASQTIYSALCATYSTHKDNFLKRLEPECQTGSEYAVQHPRI
ncbi:MAG: hypothetical protein ACSLEN_13525 [Candidatus Malihini olakiniferum]